MWRRYSDLMKVGAHLFAVGETIGFNDLETVSAGFSISVREDGMSELAVS
jgi:hypothetical protein